MSRVRVKICGITSVKDLLVAVEAGADAVGFIVNVSKSPRNLPVEKAKQLMRLTPLFVETVVVTVPEDLNLLERTCGELNPDVIQVHYLQQQQKEIRERLSDARLIGAIQVKTDFAIDSVLEVADICDAILLDSYVQGKFGGTGRTHDWEVSKRVREIIHPRPFVLAGG